MTTLRQRFGSGLRWLSISQAGRQVMLLGTLVLLSRLVQPEDFGVLSMATTITAFVDLFKDLGSAAAIVQRRELSQRFLSTIFWVNTGLGVLSTLILLVLAPFVALLFREPAVTLPLQALSIALAISGTTLVQQALLQKKMAFGALAQIELGSTIMGMLVAVGVALAGGGIWSLVAQSLVTVSVTAVLSWTIGRWQPSWAFEGAALMVIRDYSLNLVGFNSINYFIRNADNILIGRFLGATELGYYTLAYRLMLYPIQNLSIVVGRILFPALAHINDDPIRVRRVYLQVIGAIGVFSFPLFAGLAALSDLLIELVFGPSWQPAAAILAILVPVGIVQALSHTVGAIYQVTGRTDLLLRWGIAAGFVTISSFLIGLGWGVTGVALGYTVASLALAYPSLKIPFALIDLPVSALGVAIARPALCSLALFALIVLTRAALPSALPLITQLALPAAAGAFAYGAMSWLVNRAQLLNLVTVIYPNR